MNQDQIVQDRIRKVVAVLIILMMLFGLRLIEILSDVSQEPRVLYSLLIKYSRGGLCFSCPRYLCQKC